jgi:anti-anti-sigma regulatory factor
VLVVPLIGTLDERRARSVLEATLAGASHYKARSVILDITGVRKVDPIAAQTLLAIASALRLLGAQAILTGVRGEIAQEFVRLDVDLSELVTRTTLHGGLEVALARAERRSSRASR